MLGGGVTCGCFQNFLHKTVPWKKYFYHILEDKKGQVPVGLHPCARWGLVPLIMTLANGIAVKVSFIYLVVRYSTVIVNIATVSVHVTLPPFRDTAS